MSERKVTFSIVCPFGYLLMKNIQFFFLSLQSLVPLILYVCEDDEEDEEEEDDTFLTSDEKKSIYSKAVNLLMSLTLPLECLVCSANILVTTLKSFCDLTFDWPNLICNWSRRVAIHEGSMLTCSMGWDNSL